VDCVGTTGGPKEVGRKRMSQRAWVTKSHDVEDFGPAPIRDLVNDKRKRPSDVAGRRARPVIDPQLAGRHFAKFWAATEI